MKKIIIIAGSAIGAILLGAIGYFMFSNILKTAPPIGTANAPAKSTPASPAQTAGLVSALTDSQVLAYSVQGSEVDAIQATGEVIQVTNGKTNVISSSRLNDVMAASFSFDGKKALVKYGTAHKYFYTVFDRSTMLWTGLGGESIRAADWSPTSTNEIVYLEKTANDSAIGIINTGKLQDPKKPEFGFIRTVVANINELDSDITWLSKNEIIISSKPARYVPSTILKYKVKEKIFEPIVLGVMGASIKWDKSSGQGVEHAIAQNKDSVTVIDASGAARAQLFFTTMPEKCAINQIYLYCAIPKDSSNVKLPDDYLMKAAYFDDDFYRTSLVDGKTELILGETGGRFDGRELQVANDKVYFINNLDGRLYSFVEKAK